MGERKFVPLPALSKRRSMKVLRVGDLYFESVIVDSYVTWSRTGAPARGHLRMPDICKRQFPSDHRQGKRNDRKRHFRPEIDRHVCISVFARATTPRVCCSFTATAIEEPHCPPLLLWPHDVIRPSPQYREVLHVDTLLCAGRLLDGVAHRARRERRKIRSEKGRPRRRRAAHRRLFENQSARARAGDPPG